MFDNVENAVTANVSYIFTGEEFLFIDWSNGKSGINGNYTHKSF